MIYNVLKYGTALGILILILVGCDGTVPIIQEEPAIAHMIEANQEAADAIIEGASGNLDLQKPIVAVSFVNIDNLEQSSSFGRIVSKQIAARFTQHRLSIIEMLVRKDIFVKQNRGEFLLSRNLRNLTIEYDAQAVIAGVYAIGRKTVYVTALLIRATDSVVLASKNYELPINTDIEELLRCKVDCDQ